LKQYELWWASLPQPAGRRPVLLLSRDDAYEHLNKFVAVEITTTIRHIPVEVLVGKEEGLSKMCVANCDNLRTVPRVALVKKIGQLGVSRRGEVKRAMGYAFRWYELTSVKLP
jgi:mRNA interferase MazF